MKRCSWPPKPTIRSPEATPTGPSSVRTRTIVASNCVRGLVSQLARKGGSKFRRCWVISIPLIFTLLLPLSGLVQHDAGEHEEILVGDRPLVGLAHRGILGLRHLPRQTLGRDIVVTFTGEGDLDADAAQQALEGGGQRQCAAADRKSTRLNSSHQIISYAVFCLKKKKSMP